MCDVGSGGPLSENERIDDIQDADLLIDDIVLYDVATDGEKPRSPADRSSRNGLIRANNERPSDAP